MQESWLQFLGAPFWQNICAIALLHLMNYPILIVLFSSIICFRFLILLLRNNPNRIISATVCEPCPLPCKFHCLVGRSILCLKKAECSRNNYSLSIENWHTKNISFKSYVMCDIETCSRVTSRPSFESPLVYWKKSSDFSIFLQFSYLEMRFFTLA